MNDLFGHSPSDLIRTLGFYEPFCTLMLHGKIETRCVRAGRKPPFPRGKYILYTTKEPAKEKIYDWCSPSILQSIYNTIRVESQTYNGYALAIGKLVELYPMRKEDEEKAFVNFVGTKTFLDKDSKEVSKVQWCLKFDAIWRIEPFIFEFGKQGVGILPDSEHSKIKII